LVSIIVLGNEIPKQLQTGLNNQLYRDFEVILASEEGIVNAMNIALAKAKGDIFVRIDTDVKLSKRWLLELMKPFKDPTVAGATGPTYIPKDLRKNRVSIKMAEKPNWFFNWMFDNEPYLPARIYKCGSVSYGSNFEELMNRNYDIDHLEGTNWAMRTELIRAVGGFDPKFDGVAEWFDTDVLFKILKLRCQPNEHSSYQYKIKYCPNAILWHLIGKPTMNFDKRKDTWGRIRNWLRFHWRHSKFYWKKGVWLCFLIAYALRTKKYR